MNKRQKKALIRIILSAIIILTIELLNLDGGLKFWLYFIPYLIIGYDILIKAVKGILRGQVFSENFLMAIASVGAIVLGDGLEGSAVMLFYQVGELFQSVALGKSRKSIAALMDIPLNAKKKYYQTETVMISSSSSERSVTSPAPAGQK